jgi:hypothetical protein
MQQRYTFYTQTTLALGLVQLFKQLEERLSLHQPLKVYIAGGMAVHLYTASRVTTDVDAEFAARILLPNDLMQEIALEDGTPQILYLDTNYNPSFALMHEDYQNDAVAVELGLQYLQIFVLSPVDLAVSKIARFADNDRADIAQLVRLQLTNAQAIEERANAALAGYVGGQAMLQLNLRDAIALAHATQRPQ